MRLFLGIDLPAEIKDYLFDEVQAKLKNNSLAKVAWDGKKKFHITLKFLGEVPEKDLGKLKEKLREIHFHNIKIKLNGLFYFPGGSKIKVIWVGVNPEEQIIELQKLVDYATIYYGDVRLGAPHVTLGRVKFIKHKKGLLEKFANVKVDSLEFTANSFSLFKSVLTKDGSTYETLETFLLN